MDINTLATFLRRTVNCLPALVENLTDEQFRWKPPSGNWSVLEILGHMLAEERFDFRPRVQLTLEDPTQPWPSYDPEGIVAEEKFNEKNPSQILSEFIEERNESLRWLDKLAPADWKQCYQHPRIGPLHAGDLFASWVAHDQLHIRQIAKRYYEMINECSQPFQTDYAGNLS